MSVETIQQAFKQAVREHRAGKLDEAESLCRSILVLDPKHADATHLLGMVAFSTDRLGEAHDLFQQAIDLSRITAEYHASLGMVLARERRVEEAIAAYRQALTLEPDLAEIHYQLALALTELGRPDEALVAYRRAIELKPRFLDAFNHLGHLLRKWNRLEEAIEAYQEVLNLKPDAYEALNNMGAAQKDLARIDEAVACFDRALLLRPDAATVRSNRLYALHFHVAATGESLRLEHQEWNRLHALPLIGEIRPHENDRIPNRRLKIGYVSADFRVHCQAMFTIPLLSQHDHEKFEIFCYSDVVIEDSITRRIKSLADVWRSTTGMSDEQLAELIRKDGIDLLVDLSLHMANNRKPVFARKPAPVQISWLGYPSTTGLAAMDYRLTDPYLDPPGENDAFYSEESIRLPNTFWCYDPLADEPEVGELPAARNGYVTFACLNNFCKVNDQVLHLWSRVLQVVPNSRFRLLAPRGKVREHVLRLLGVDPPRVELLDFLPRPLYLQRYQEIDICLDTFPYNGHTTSLDALWMGVPVVSLCGQTAISRAGFSQMSNLGMLELVAHLPDEFVRIAVELAGDLGRLKELRTSLRTKMRQSPLMDAPRFARNMEQACRMAWERYCAKGQMRKSTRNRPMMMVDKPA